VIEPDVHDVLWDGFALTPRLVASGAAATRAMLPQIKAALERRTSPDQIGLPEEEPR
jgi:hypothetical protein